MKRGELDKKEIKKYNLLLKRLKKEIAKIIVGQEEITDSLIRAILANGHVLVEGVPGIAKTLLIRALAKATGCTFSRIQFTIDLLPTDIVGITAYDPKKGFTTHKGPIFSNFILADEINRSSPKTQSAMLEAMQEKQVTIGKKTYPLQEPFFVMATMNPIESEGVYPLPEAQIDRFLFKSFMGYPTMKEEQKILNQNITLRKFEDYDIKSVISSSLILHLQEITKKVYLSKEIEEYITNIVNITRKPKNLKLGRYIMYGGSPRASISLFIASKADALMQGKSYVTPQNIKNVAPSVLRHRILLNYEGQAENIKTDQIISEILAKTPIP